VDAFFAVPLSAVVEISRIQDHEIHKVDQREVPPPARSDPHARSASTSSIAFTRSKTRIPQRRKEIFVVVIGLGEKRFGLV